MKIHHLKTCKIQLNTKKLRALNSHTNTKEISKSNELSQNLREKENKLILEIKNGENYRHR